MRPWPMMIAVAAIAATAAAAQTPDEVGGVAPAAPTAPELTITLADVCAELTPGRTVQVSLAGGADIVGHFAGWDGCDLQLIRDGRPEVLAGDDVLALWERERRTVGGLTAGAVLGGVGGGAFMALVSLAWSGLDDDGVPALPLIASGLVIGAAGGGLVGASVGAALPVWSLRYATPGADLDRHPVPAPIPAPGRRLGSVTLLAGAARNLGVDTPHGDLSLRLGLLAERGERLAFGPEFGRYLAGPARRPRFPWPEPNRSTTVWHAGGAAHLYLLTGPVRPYVSAGLAFYSWNESFLGWNTGVGARLRLGETADWICEYRHHANLQHLTETEPRLATVLAGVAFAW